MEGIHVVLADTHPIGLAGKRILALVHQLFRDLAPEAALIEMHLSIEPESLAPYEASDLAPPQILVLRDETNNIYVFGLSAQMPGSGLRPNDALNSILASLAMTTTDTADLPRHRVVTRLATRQTDQTKLAQLNLTSREVDVLQQLAAGKTDRAIADQLGVKPRTIRYHLQNIYTKLGLKQRGEAIAWAIRAGLVAE